MTPPCTVETTVIRIGLGALPKSDFARSSFHLPENSAFGVWAETITARKRNPQRTGTPVNSLLPQIFSRNLRERRATCQSHRHLQFGSQNLDDTCDALRSAHRESVYVRASDQDRCGPARQGFENVDPASHAAIEQQRYVSANTLGNQRQSIDGRRNGIQAASAMV